MSVIVKGMEMPKSCGRCWFNDSSLSCAITGSCIDRDDEYGDRLDDCPIVALPDKHGRLVDADAIKNENPLHMKLDVPYVTEVTVGEIIDDAQTIIEAEDSE